MAQAAKRAGRATTEGLVGYRIEGDSGTMVAVGCETEPVSKNDEFQAFAKNVLETVHADGPEAVDSLEQDRVDVGAKLGENIVVVGAERYEVGDGEVVNAYVHPPANKIGVIVKLEGGTEELARQLAMHISFAAPEWTTRDDVPAETIEAERQVYLNSDELEGKPEQAKEKIVEGMLGKRFFAAAAGRRARRPAVDPRLGEDGGSGARARPERVPSRSSASLSQNRRVTTHEELAERAPAGAAPAFRRVLLKLSGEALMGEHEYGIDPKTVDAIAARDRRGPDAKGVELAIVVGGGNIYRGIAAAAEGMDRATADYAGMLATVLNALALQDALERLGADTRVLSALEMSRGRRAVHPPPRDAPPREGPRRHLRRRHRQPVLHHRHRRRAARARDRRAGDPDGEERRRGRLRRRPEGAIPTRPFLPALTHLEAIERGLRVMDTTALSLCMENALPIHVFELADGNILRVATGEQVGTIISTPKKEG